MPATIDLQIFYAGRVQGVGFRYSVKKLASGYDIVGWVRNLSDGRVELQVSGEEVEVEKFLKAVAESQLRTHIKQVERFPQSASCERNIGFKIRH